jgi:hypothetical protein
MGIPTVLPLSRLKTVKFRILIVSAIFAISALNVVSAISTSV